MMLRSWLLLACFSTLTIASLGCGDTSSSGGGGAGNGGGGNTGGQNLGGGALANCVAITQTTDGKTLSATGAVGFEFEPSMGAADIPDVISVSPISLGKIPLGPQTLEYDPMDHNRSAVFASVDAVTDLINATPADMDARLFVAVSGTMTIDKAPPDPTQFEGRVKGSLTNLKFLELDDTGDVIEDGDCLFLAAGDFDAADWVEDCNAEVDIANTPSGGACMADYANIGHDCNPVTNDGCLATQICDWGGYFHCYDVVGDEVGLCQPCENTRGPLCQAGMTCDSENANGICYRYCCTDDDCGPGATCIAYSFAPIGVGVCLTQ